MPRGAGSAPSQPYDSAPPASDDAARRSDAAPLARLLGWVAVPAMLVMSLFDLRRGPTGKPALVSSFAIGATICVLLGLPVLARAWRGRTALHLAWRMVGVFGLLLLWSLVRVFTHGRRIAYHLLVPTRYLVVPIVEAGLTCLMGLVLALAIPPARRRERFWWVGWAVLAGSCVGWVRGVVRHGLATRLNTGLGGAATLQLPLLLVLAGFLACLLDGWRRRSSAAGAVLAAMLVVATGSRAGIVLLVALLVASLVARGGRRARGTLAAAGGAVLLVGLVVAITPFGQRFVHWSDVGRLENVQVVGRALDSASHWLCGVGVGTIWPWFIYDAGLTRAPYRGLQTSPYGITATNPHSLYLGALGELGVIGLALVLALMALCLWAWYRSTRGGATAVNAASMADAPRDGTWQRTVLTMVALSWLAFAVDYYLLKNFAVSFLWWFTVFLAVPRSPEPIRESA